MSCKGLNPPVKGFIDTSFLDWKGHLSSVIFLGGCNFRCPFCHNKDLVIDHQAMEDMPVEYIVAHFRKYKDWIDRVVITGGEPTISMELFGLIGKLKSEGLFVKLDTNGSNPSIVKGLVKDGLVDYVAMDVKGPVDRYERWCGVPVDQELIRESIAFLMENTVDYEFRMTVVPFLHREVDIYEVASLIRGARRFFIQEFRPESTLNPAYTRIRPFPPDKIARIKSRVARIMSRDERLDKAPVRQYEIANQKSHAITHDQLPS
ncbi:MAG TPA: anaerobic ribonucleoside-triphosphate reductase activating protein [Syntrophorhabdaceae bacterium]|nr:anaerobic ribonucleoside-triphosphate reductase activating protein [Syntrophorhabdaceae bacterium]